VSLGLAIHNAGPWRSWIAATANPNIDFSYGTGSIAGMARTAARGVRVAGQTPESGRHGCAPSSSASRANRRRICGRARRGMTTEEPALRAGKTDYRFTGGIARAMIQGGAKSFEPVCLGRRATPDPRLGRRLERVRGKISVLVLLLVSNSTGATSATALPRAQGGAEPAPCRLSLTRGD